MRRFLGFIGLFTLVIAGYSLASAQTISIFYGASRSCSIPVPPGTTQFGFSIVAVLGGPVVGGIMGGEFKIEGIPADWFGTPGIWDAGQGQSVFIGDLTQGFIIEWASCQRDLDRDGMVPLASYTGLRFSDVPATGELRIVAHQRARPEFPCPALIMCDNVTLCVSGTHAVINGPCSVAVERKSWSTIKQLYD